MDFPPRHPEAAPPEIDPIPLDSILSEPLTHPLVLTPARIAAQPPPIPPAADLTKPATPGSVWRDAILDLAAPLGIWIPVMLLIAVADAITRAGRQSQALSPWALAALFGSLQVLLYLFARRRLNLNRQKGRPFPELFLGEPAPAAIWGFLAGLVLALSGGAYSYVVQRLMGQEALPQQLDFLREVASDRLMMGLFVVIIAVMAPICEEMLFRGAMFASAKASGLAVPGAAVSALLFSLAHLSLPLIPFYVLFALTMCWLFSRTRTLVAPMFAHFTMNGLACLALIVQGPSEII